LHRAGPFVIGIPEVGWVGVFGMMDFAICLRQREAGLAKGNGPGNGQGSGLI